MINLSGSSMGIGLAIRLRDEFTSKSRAISREFESLYGNAKRVQEANLRAVRGIGTGMAVAGLAGTKAFSNAFKVSADYDFTLRTIKILTNASTKEFEQMNSVITNLGTNSIYTISDVASAMEQLIRQGFSANQAIKALPGIVYLGAAAGGKPIGGKGGMGDTVANIMHQFNLEASQSSRVADLLAMTANKSASDVEDLGEALKHSAGKAHQLGFSLEEVLSLFAVLSNAGLKGGIAGRGVFSMMTYLTRAASSFRTNRQVEAFNAIGLSLNDILDKTGNLRPMGAILDVFGTKLRRMSKVEASGALSALMMMRGDRTMLPLLEKMVKVGMNFKETQSALLKDSYGYAKRISDYQMAGPKGKLMMLQDTLYALSVKVGQIISKFVEPALSGITWFLGKIIAFTNTPLGNGLVILAAALSLALAAAGTFLVVFTSIRLMALASTVSFANMGSSLTLAWTEGAAAAARYAMVARGAMLTPTGGVVMRGAGGRFVSVAGAAGSTAVAGSVMGKRGLGGFIASLTTASGILGLLGKLVRGFFGPIGFVLGILFGFGNMIKSVIYALGSLINAIMYVYDLATSFSFDYAGENMKRRNDALLKSLGFDDGGITGRSAKEKAADYDMTHPQTGFQKKQQQLDSLNGLPSVIQFKTQMNLDSKKLSEAQDSMRREELLRLTKGVRQ